VDDAMKGLLQAAGTAIRELYELVMERHGSSEGGAARVCAFWTTGGYLNKAKVVKEKVQKALDALMLPSAPTLFPSTSPRTTHPRPSTLDPRPSTLNPQPSSSNPQPSSASRSRRDSMCRRCWTARTASPRWTRGSAR